MENHNNFIKNVTFTFLYLHLYRKFITLTGFFMCWKVKVFFLNFLCFLTMPPNDGKKKIGNSGPGSEKSLSSQIEI